MALLLDVKHLLVASVAIQSLLLSVLILLVAIMASRR